MKRSNAYAMRKTVVRHVTCARERVVQHVAHAMMDMSAFSRVSAQMVSN